MGPVPDELGDHWHSAVECSGGVVYMIHDVYSHMAMAWAMGCLDGGSVVGSRVACSGETVKVDGASPANWHDLLEIVVVVAIVLIVVVGIWIAKVVVLVVSL